MNNPKITLSQILEFVQVHASKEDRAAIVDALNASRNDDILTARMEFKVGDKVLFRPRRRGCPQVIRGVIEAKNRTTFTVATEGRTWRVSATLLERDDG